MHKNINKGFTLIELLIVIAIIGVLAATVVVSLGSKTDDAKEKTLKIGVSSIRTLASSEVATGVPAGKNVCNIIYSKISADKENWPWKGAQAAYTDDKGTPDNAADDVEVDAVDGIPCSPRVNEKGIFANGATLQADRLDGDICCATNATHDWMIWGKLPTDTEGYDVYCADSKQFLGELKASDANTLPAGSTIRCKS